MARARRRLLDRLAALSLLLVGACASKSGAARDGGPDHPMGVAGMGGGGGSGDVGGSGSSGNGGGGGSVAGGRGGSSVAGSTASGGTGAAPPSGLFPLHVAAGHGSLIGDDGRPFLLHAEAA